MSTCADDVLCCGVLTLKCIRKEGAGRSKRIHMTLFCSHYIGWALEDTVIICVALELLLIIELLRLIYILKKFAFKSN